MHCKYLPWSHTKPLKSFLRLCMGKREVRTVHEFSVLSSVDIALSKFAEIFGITSLVFLLLISILAHRHYYHA